MRIGLVADTHMPPWDRRIMQDIEDAFGGVDLIMHAGDIVTLAVLDWLEGIAPVVAAIGNNDVHLPADARLEPYQRVDCEGVTIGMFHVYEPWQVPPGEFVRKYFAIESVPDVIVIGDTHVETVERRDEVLVVNPGSPTSSHLRVDLPGTVALLTIDDGSASAEIVSLSVPHQWS